MIPLVLTQYVEEAALLWVRRQYASGQPHIDLQDLVQIDERIVAQLDGLRLAGDEGWALCAENLAWGEPGEVFTATVMALESDRPERRDLAWQYAFRSRELEINLAETLGWLPQRQVAKVLAELANGSASQQAVAWRAACQHGISDESSLVDALRSEDNNIAEAAVHCVARLGLLKHLSEVRAAHRRRDTSSLVWAWTLALLDEDAPEVADLMQADATTAGMDLRDLFTVLLSRLDAETAEAWIEQLAAAPGGQRPAIIASGIQGRISRLPWLVDQLQDPRLARLAGEAIHLLTGVDFSDSDFEGAAPDDFEAGPTEDPDDEDVSMDPDENLPWPNASAFEEWWLKYRDHFDPGLRYLVGCAADTNRYQEVLRGGTQRLRAIAALELAIRQPGQPVFDVRAPGARQMQLLGGSPTNTGA